MNRLRISLCLVLIAFPLIRGDDARAERKMGIHPRIFPSVVWGAKRFFIDAHTRRLDKRCNGFIYLISVAEDIT